MGKLVTKTVIAVALGMIACVRATHAQSQETIAIDSGSGSVFNQSNAVLSGGSVLDGDGDVVQLGYFSGPNFTGTFTPLSGEGSANTAIVPDSTAEPYNKTSVGDVTLDGGGDGTFFFTLNFVVGNASSGNNLPATGTQLALRIYNNTTIASSTFFNTVTDADWIWQTPAAPPSNPVVSVSLDEPGLLWQGGVNSAFHTTIATAVPEPATVFSLLLGAATLAVTTRRRKS